MFKKILRLRKRLCIEKRGKEYGVHKLSEVAYALNLSVTTPSGDVSILMFLKTAVLTNRIYLRDYSAFTPSVGLVD